MLIETAKIFLSLFVMVLLVLIASHETREPHSSPPFGYGPSDETSLEEEALRNVGRTVQPERLPAAPRSALNPGMPINADLRAVVNIICSTDSGSILHPIMGSGVIMDPRGVILTNAHIAQYFLLSESSENKATCEIRTGNPAQRAYRAELLYLPPPWIRTHARDITQTIPVGTGEHDYAFLLITESLSESRLPRSFPALPWNSTPELIKVNDRMLLAGYPADTLNGGTLAQAVYQKNDYAFVEEVFTFDHSSLDLISLKGALISERGTSGGPAINTRGELVGIIVARGTNPADGTPDLRVLTLEHIERSLHAFGKGSINELLTGSLVRASEEFRVYGFSSLAPLLKLYLK